MIRLRFKRYLRSLIFASQVLTDICLQRVGLLKGVKSGKVVERLHQSLLRLLGQVLTEFFECEGIIGLKELDKCYLKF